MQFQLKVQKINLVIILCFIIRSHPNIITQNFNFMFGVYRTFIHFGNDKVTQNLDIDLANNFTWIKNEFLERRDISSAPSIKFEYDTNSTTDLFLFKEDLDIGTQSSFIRNFSHYISNTYITSILPVKVKWCIGFAPKFEDENFSVVHQLYNMKAIEKKEFGFVLKQRGFNSNSEGTIYFGGFPESLIFNGTKATCKINPQYSSWGCKLSKIIFNDSKVYLNSFYSYFNANRREIFAPVDFLNFLEKDYLNKYIENGECEAIHFMEKYEIRCNLEASKHLMDNMKFIFDNRIAFTLNLEELLDCSLSSCTLLLQGNSNFQNVWVIGTALLSKYDVLFSYDDLSITFYGDIDVRQSTKSQPAILKILIYIEIILSICMFVYNLLFYLLIMKSEYES